MGAIGWRAEEITEVLNTNNVKVIFDIFITIQCTVLPNFNVGHEDGWKR